jgi:predicted flap endonuclease-1-like 5' DNA nuclease
MIWHFFEVWILMAFAFVLGSALGALLYGVVARSRFATAQGVAADAIGDLVDSIKARLGVGPVWRPEYRRVAGRAFVAADGELDPVAFQPVAPPPSRAPAALPSPDPIPIAREVLAIAPPPESAGMEPAGHAEYDTYADDLDGPVSVEPEADVPASDIVPMRPAGLSAPRNGVPDNLQRIRGVGERNEALLNSLGIFHFGQIAAWTPGEVRWVGTYLAFPERIERDNWVGQATILASGGDTGFVKAADRRRARRQQQFDEVVDEIENLGEEQMAPDDR